MELLETSTKLLELFYGNGSVAGVWVFWVLGCFVLFSCPMKFMNQWHALYFNLFCIISLV